MYGIPKGRQSGGVVTNGRRTGQIKGPPQDFSDNDNAFDVQKHLFEALRKKIITRCGEDVLAGFGTRFRLMDRGGGMDGDLQSRKGDGRLSSYEMHVGLKQVGIDVDKKNAELLLASIDKDGSGCVSYNEFLYALRGGQMNKKRVDVTKQAFEIICAKSSQSGAEKASGYTDPVANIHDFSATYDASQHKDVLSGKKSENQVLSEFMKNFDLDGNGYVTFTEFLQYYDMMSCSYDNDDAYCLMVRNAWRISGGEGAAQGTRSGGPQDRRKFKYRADDGTIKEIELTNDKDKPIDFNNPRAVKRLMYNAGIPKVDHLYMDSFDVVNC